jgi:hypothetical protein
MRAISVQQPWPYAIFHEGKDVENRDFRPTIELPADIAIQVSNNIDKKPKLPTGFEHLADLPEAYSPEERGCVVGVVTLEEIVEDDSSIWRQGARYGWRLSNPRLLTEPVEMSGNQTTKEVPPDVLQKIKSRLRS